METKHVFEDVSGRRRPILYVLLYGLAGISSVALTFFLISLGVSALPNASQIVRHLAQKQIDHDRKEADFVLHRISPRLTATKSSHPTPAKTDASRIIMAYYAPWESAGLPSLRAHASSLTHLAPAWFHFGKDGTTLDQSDFNFDLNPKNKDVLKIARDNGIRVVPIVSNATNANFSAALLSRFLHSPAAQIQLLEKLVSDAQANQFSGFQFDFEDLRDEDYPRLTEFLKLARPIFTQNRLELSLATEPSVEPPALKQWSELVDYMVLMTYDEHSENDAPGPIASLPWYEAKLKEALSAVPSDKLVAGVGSYAYDWKVGQPGAEAISFQEGMADAAGYREGEPINTVISLDPDKLNSTYTYEDDDDKRHVVWMLDAMSAYNQWIIARRLGTRGAAVWILGTEDPQIWQFLDYHRAAQPLNPHDLEDINYPFEVDYVGKGEVLKVESRPQPGHRRVTIDPDTGMIDTVVYQSYPTTYVIRKSGSQPNKIVLTFDDGPDPQWTPQILDILRSKRAPGAFFVVGENVEANPEIAERIVAEGNEIGNHTFTHPNLGLATQKRVDLELSGTQRVIEAVTGTSSILFRPPYNADSQPETADEVTPVDRADQLGFITIGENVDPNDWAPQITNSKGESRPRTADDIVNLVMSDLALRKSTGDEGNIILLHDAGGNRAKTVAALPRLIDQLRVHGYQIVTLSDLLRIPRSQLMPPIPKQQLALVGIDRVIFTVMHALQVILFWGFLGALVLGTARIFFVVPLAIIQARRKSRADHSPPPRSSESVSALIAAYNEESTIVATVESVLGSKHPITEVIVVDDGSTDNTSEVLQSHFADDLRVHMISKPNGGKASALNMGVHEAKGTLLFCIDADTRIEPDSLGILARNFGDPKVAAVAGNVLVGNEVNLLTIWQSVEYRTCQNLDRRAYEALNAITVIPGAIGMWRKSAVLEAGGYSADTLAEDMDLTWRLRTLGYRAATESKAIAWTEAPETWSALFKQRFRWSFGTTQCLWKHRRALGRYGWFGRLVLPSLVLFQVVFQILGPFVDLQLLFTLVNSLLPLIGGSSRELSASLWSGPFVLALQLYAFFFFLEFASGWVAYRMDRAPPWPLFWLLIQRFAYRQLMYLVMFKSLWRAVTGVRQGWGKLKRTGNITPA